MSPLLEVVWDRSNVIRAHCERKGELKANWNSGLFSDQATARTKAEELGQLLHKHRLQAYKLLTSQYWTANSKSEALHQSRQVPDAYGDKVFQDNTISHSCILQINSNVRRVIRKFSTHSLSSVHWLIVRSQENPPRLGSTQNFRSLLRFELHIASITFKASRRIFLRLDETTLMTPPSAIYIFPQHLRQACFSAKCERSPNANWDRSTLNRSQRCEQGRNHSFNM